VSQFKGLHPQLIPYAETLVAWMRSMDPSTSVTSVRRSSTEQARLYRRYLAGVSQYPVAPPGRSKHEHGLAFDVVARPATLAAAGRVWESWGGRWGGRFDDDIHFEV
jgi:D-alanyl-D-alanine carboxypeptidase